ncbi:MAG: hypothetical protein ABI594_20105 [Ginsengibacter sp.]
MKARRNRNVFIFFIAAAVMGFVTGYLLWNKPHKEVKDADSVQITAIVLYKIFTEDSAIGKSKYLNSIVAVTGEVKQVSTNQQNQQIILLKTQLPDASVNCTMEENTKDVKPGDSVILKGICSGYINGDADMGLPGDVFLIRCYRSI